MSRPPVSMVALAVLVAVGLLVPLLGYDVVADVDPARAHAAPGLRHLLGTDDLGRDILKRLVLATNSNDILARFVASGTYESGDCFATLSPSMDIQVSSNFERYLFYLMDKDAAAKVMAAYRDKLKTMQQSLA